MPEDKNQPEPKPKKEKSSPAGDTAAPEIRPDGWDRFERAIDQVMKSPPKHRSKPNEKARAK